ncbi:hypothetical protein B7494_g3253 [Chlorociboria aeruginascens]|nr:hypothetical protein B7494_g3253 [Chlorociboria aeruginascens]
MQFTNIVALTLAAFASAAVATETVTVNICAASPTAASSYVVKPTVASTGVAVVPTASTSPIAYAGAASMNGVSALGMIIAGGVALPLQNLAFCRNHTRWVRSLRINGQKSSCLDSRAALRKLLVASEANIQHMASANEQIAAPKKDVPTFSPSKVTVLFVLGGPGAGKGTQCANLVRDYHFTHLAAGDLLRAEQDREGSEFGDLIRDNIKNGIIVPMEITVQLLENAMTDVISKSPDKRGKFLIDGFPRKMDQALKFEESVCPSKFVLFFDCPEEEMQRRLLERGKTSGRADDNAESIKKRFKVFVETSMPVVDYFDKEGRVVKVVATKTPEEVYKETRQKLEERLGKNF